MKKTRRSLGTIALASCLALCGCGPATYNVRASRAFANEEAELPVVDDRAADLARAVELADELLLATPYAPGDAWPRALRLDDDQADKLRDGFEERPPYSGDHEVALAKLYRVALEQALAKAKAERPSRPAKHTSILAALATLAPEARDLPAQWTALVKAQKDLTAKKRARDWLEWQSMNQRREPPKLATARADAAAAEQELARATQALQASASGLAVRLPPGEKQTVARDGLEAVALLLRLHIESLGVAPYVVKQAKRLQRSDGVGGEVVPKVEDTAALLETERRSLEQLANVLTMPAEVSLADTGGFVMHENAIAQAARVNFDATHIHVKGDAELLFYHLLQNPDERIGRTRRLEYSIDPVFMTGGRIIAAYDFLHVKNAASLNAGFTTDRLFSSGGDIENQGSLGNLLGLEGLASDFFDIGMDLLGVHTSLVIAKFTSGEVRQIAIDPTTGRDTGVVDKAPFQLTYNQIDVGYDFTVLAPDLAEDLYVESFIAGFRYLDYHLPRILYELRERTPEEGKGYVFNRQTPAQSVESQFFMGGLSLRLGQGEWPRVSFFGDLGIYGGAGPGEYYFKPNPTEPGGKRERKNTTMLAFDGNAAAGVRFRLTKQRRPRVVVEVSYHGDIIGEGAITQINERRNGSKTTYTVGKSIDLGGFDIFHGPRLILVLVL